MLKHVAEIAGDDKKAPWGKHWIEKGFDSELIDNLLSNKVIYMLLLSFF